MSLIPKVLLDRTHKGNERLMFSLVINYLLWGYILLINRLNGFTALIAVVLYRSFCGVCGL